MPLSKTNLWLDAEWYIEQRIFLIGYAYNTRKCHQLYGSTLTRAKFKAALKKVKGFVFGYGPDVGMCEKHFRWKFRNKYKCVNLMKVFRDHLKRTASFKLKDLENKFGLRRKVSKYKADIFRIFRDWHDPRKRYAVLTYNKEDVINLIKLTYIVFKKHKVTISYLKTIRLS